MALESLYFLRKVLTWRRVFNTAVSYSGYLVSNLIKRPVVLGMPMMLNIEPTNICNLRCPLCPSGTNSLKRPRGMMEPDVFKKVIDQVKDTAMMVILWNQGEPFLHKSFLDMVKIASDARLYTYVSSNLNVMPDPHAIVKSGLDTLIVSLDGATQETYNKYRVNGNLQTVLDNVKRLVQAKKELNSKTPIIKWQFLVMKHNEHEIEQIRQQARQLGVDKIDLKTVQIYSASDIDEFLPLNPKWRRYKVTPGGEFELKFGLKNRCRRMWGQPVVNWDGEVAVCCFDKDNQYKVGNIKAIPFKRIWHGRPFNNMRRHILANRAAIPMCRNCGEGVKLNIQSKRK